MTEYRKYIDLGSRLSNLEMRIEERGRYVQDCGQISAVQIYVDSHLVEYACHPKIELRWKIYDDTYKDYADMRYESIVRFLD